MVKMQHTLSSLTIEPLQLIQLLELCGLDMMNLFISPISENYEANEKFFFHNMGWTEATGCYIYNHLGENNSFPGSCFDYVEMINWLFAHNRVRLGVDPLDVTIPMMLRISTHFHQFNVIVIDLENIYLSDYYQEACRESDLWTRKLTIHEYTSLVRSLQERDREALEAIIGHTEELEDVEIDIFEIDTISLGEIKTTFEANIGEIVADSNPEILGSDIKPFTYSELIEISARMSLGSVIRNVQKLRRQE